MNREEILVLVTDVQSARETAVLEFMPFPAEPVLALAPDGAFDRLQEILNAHRVANFRGVGAGKGAGRGEAVDLIPHRRLGVHDVTVVRVNDPGAFALWVEAYFRENGFPVRELTDDEKAVVADYCGRGFNYFVFDLVHVGRKVRSVPPLGYRFRTPALYYPLKVTALYGRTGRVDLVLCGGWRLLDRVYYQLTLRHRRVAYLNGKRRDLAALAATYAPGGRVPAPTPHVANDRFLLPALTFRIDTPPEQSP